MSSSFHQQATGTMTHPAPWPLNRLLFKSPPRPAIEIAATKGAKPALRQAEIQPPTFKTKTGLSHICGKVR